MKTLIITVAVAAIALTGCEQLTGDHITPVKVQGPDAVPTELQPGLWTANPLNSEDGCLWSVFRNGYPILFSEVHDSVPVYVWLPASTDTDDYGFTTRGCTEWKRVSQ